MSATSPILRAKLAAQRAVEARERAEDAVARLTQLHMFARARGDQVTRAEDLARQAESNLHAARRYAAEAHQATADVLLRLATLYEGRAVEAPSSLLCHAKAAEARREAAWHQHLAQPSTIHAKTAALSVVSHHDGDVGIVTAVGELDLTTGADLHIALATHVTRGCVRIVLNLASLEFCDAAGLRVLLEFHRRTTAAGGWLRLAGVHGAVERLLEVTGLLEVVTVHADVAEALAAQEGGPAAEPSFV
ncbi:STAS domain-containing protein [Thermoactinospora rubra]|uniref:STAS domain-containing protein n=1 Tax=Thermoactinospora rubra TaxID=1088767 RepID=UPI000A0FF0AB|nr:STAS domain-containing protein [Thermoactinospora rubra]